MWVKEKSHRPIHKAFNTFQPSNEYEIEFKRGMESQINTQA